MIYLRCFRYTIKRYSQVKDLICTLDRYCSRIPNFLALSLRRRGVSWFLFYIGGRRNRGREMTIAALNNILSFQPFSHLVIPNNVKNPVTQYHPLHRRFREPFPFFHSETEAKNLGNQGRLCNRRTPYPDSSLRSVLNLGYNLITQKDDLFITSKITLLRDRQQPLLALS